MVLKNQIKLIPLTVLNCSEGSTSTFKISLLSVICVPQAGQAQGNFKNEKIYINHLVSPDI